MPMTTHCPRASAAFACLTTSGTFAETQSSLNSRWCMAQYAFQVGARARLPNGVSVSACDKHALSFATKSAHASYAARCFGSSAASTARNSACRNDNPLLTYLPLAFISIASISRNPTPRCFIASMNAFAS